jgi:flavin reductase (DIM6/NTAB) family NADH-FMN oxidoreductase RutF
MTSGSGEGIDPHLFRKTMGCFATGVTVVTTKNQGQLEGMTVNSFTSVSLRPTLILICLTRDARTTVAIEGRGWFVVNILREEQAALSNHFARPAEDHFSGVEFDLNEHDLPVLRGCIAHLVCSVESTMPAGDHFIILARVCHAEFTGAAPLIFLHGAYSKAEVNKKQEPPDAGWYW